MSTAVMDSSLSCAKEHLETAKRLRYWASKLSTTEARTKLSRLAELRHAKRYTVFRWSRAAEPTRSFDATSLSS